MQRIQELAAISETDQGITRTFGSPAWREAALTIQGWMQEAGLHAWIDNIGNVRGRLAAAQPAAKTWVIASHTDTVPDAGKFDGLLGVVMGLDVVEQLALAHTPLPFDIELIAFSDEEGCRFHTTFLGSQVVAGTFKYTLLDSKDAGGHTLRQVIHANGGHESQLPADALPRQQWLGYFEIHIEQGPVLYEKQVPVALVKAITGQKRVALTFTGTGGHAGTVPMDMRCDALCCAAEFILAVENTARQHKDKVVATVGQLQVANAASNVIPGAVTCTLDLRSTDEKMLLQVSNSMQETGAKIAAGRGVTFEWEDVQVTSPVWCDESMNALLSQSIEDTGYPVLSLTSGAGHDAVAIAAVAPVCMLFVRCFEGISHHPKENVELKDLTAALQVADNFVQRFISAHSPA